MPLNIDTLATNMKEFIEADMLAAFNIPVENDERLQVFCRAISRAIIPHFITNAVVETDGSNAGGPLHGVGTITS